LVLSELLGLVGLNVASGAIVNAFRAAGLVLAGWLAYLLLTNCRRIGTELALGLTLVIGVLLGPVMWPWYLPPAILVVVAPGIERFRPAFTVACIGASFFVLPTSAQASLGSSSLHSIFRLFLFMAIAAGALLAQWFAREPVLPEPVRKRLQRRAEREALAPA
jgi:hypothetical protein